MTLKKPASFMTPTLMFSINMMEAARRQKVKRYLFTSNIHTLIFDEADETLSYGFKLTIYNIIFFLYQ